MGASSATKVTLARRSGNQCAFPGCPRELTVDSFSGSQPAIGPTRCDTVAKSRSIGVWGQRAKVLELAAAEAKTHGFQYIRTLNSDDIPCNEFSQGFKLDDRIRLRLTDADVSGCLMGVRY